MLSCSIMSDSLQPHGLWPARLLCPWGFSRQEYRNGLQLFPPGARPNPGIEPRSPTLQTDSLPVELPGKVIIPAAAAAAKSLQSCLTLCDHIDGSPPGSAIPEILKQEHWSGLPFTSPVHESEK